MPKQHTQSALADSDAVTWEDIYNLLMYDIEPELITDIIPELDDWYRDESEEEKHDRGERYVNAFEELFNRLGKINAIWKREILAVKDKILLKHRKQSQEQESVRLEELEQTFSTDDK